MNNQVMDKETARAELERFADAMDIDLTIDADAEKKEKKDAEKTQGVVVAAIQKGTLIIGEDGTPTYTPTRSKGVPPIVFHEATGATLIASDRFGENQKLHKLYAMIANMCEVPDNTFSKLSMGDLRVVLAVGGLFLG